MNTVLDINQKFSIDNTDKIIGCKRKIASTLTFLGGCFAATNI